MKMTNHVAFRASSPKIFETVRLNERTSMTPNVDFVNLDSESTNNAHMATSSRDSVRSREEETATTADEGLE
jgi:hypothetical protein